MHYNLIICLDLSHSLGGNCYFGKYLFGLEYGYYLAKGFD